MRGEIASAECIFFAAKPPQDSAGISHANSAEFEPLPQRKALIRIEARRRAKNCAGSGELTTARL